MEALFVHSGQACYCLAQVAPAPLMPRGEAVTTHSHALLHTPLSNNFHMDA